MTSADALRLLADLGASPWLVRHHELVVEAAAILCERVPRELGVSFDREQVLVGAALHDAGKIRHPDEMRAPGSRHERAGEQLLIERGVEPALARFCATHAAWDRPELAIEDLLVALADKLWKGKREDELERRVAEVIARASGRESWAVFDRLDAVCDDIAAGGPERLARSNV